VMLIVTTIGLAAALWVRAIDRADGATHTPQA